MTTVAGASPSGRPGRRITVREAIKDLKPFVAEQ